MSHEAEQLRAEILRLFRELQRLPKKPDGSHAHASPTYLALEAQIRELATRYQATTHEARTDRAAGVDS